MPYKSDRQRRWAHTKAGTKALGGKKKVAEWDEASSGKKLPERAKKRRLPSGASGSVASILGYTQRPKRRAKK